MRSLLSRSLMVGVVTLIVPQANAIAKLSPSPDAEPALQEEKSQDPVQAKLTGITTMLTRHKALLEIRDPAQRGGLVKVIMGEGDRYGAVEVLNIDVEKSMVQIRNGNLITNLTFEPGGAPPSPKIPQESRPIKAAAEPGQSGEALSSAEGNEDEMFPPGLLKFQDADLLQALDIYQELSGRTVLRPASLPAAKISLRSQTSLTRAEALQLMDSALALNGVVMIPQGDKVVKAVPAVQATQEAAPMEATSPDDLPESGTFTVQVVRLAHRQPKELVSALQPLAKNPQAVLGIDAGQLLVLRDHSANVKRMLELIRRLDQAPDRTTPKRGEVFVVYLLAALVGLVCSKWLLGWPFGRLWPVWCVALGLGWMMFLHRFPKNAPDMVAGEAAAWGALGAGVLFLLLVPFLVKLYRKWMGIELTEEESSPNAAALRAWLHWDNLVWGAALSFFAWLGFGLSFWGVLLLTVVLLLAYPFLTLRGPEVPTSPLDAMAEHRERALKLLADGVVTAQECTNLLNALSRTGQARSSQAWLAGPWQKLVMIGSLLVLIGFFLPWHHATSEQPGQITGGEVWHGLGWWVLLCALLSALLPWLADRWDPAFRRRLILCALGAGSVILLYLVAHRVSAVGFGLCLVLLGYGLEWVGTFKSGPVPED